METIKISILTIASKSKIWKALTDKNEMKNWFFDLIEFKAEVGFVFTFMAGKTPKQLYKHICKVEESVFEQKISFSWQFENEPGNSLVSFTIIPVSENYCKINFSHVGILTFGNNPDLAINEFRIGWNTIITENLRNYLAKNLA